MTTRCESCHQKLPDGSPGPVCPRCLLAAGLAGAAPEEPSGADATRAERAALTVAKIAPHFPQLEIGEALGEGGMGIVFRANQLQLDRLVALKILWPDLAREPQFAERFTREARALASLDHPSIVDVYDFGETDGLYWLLMEYVEGSSLRDAMQGGTLDPSEAMAIVPPICEALQYAHDKGVVHRDIKPGNILLGAGGRVKIADFGLAKMVGRAPTDVTITRTGQVMGTLHYMAPEQYKTPQDVDHRADIYSLGVVFYEMLTGDVPMGSFLPPSQCVDVDRRVDGVVLRALAREREQRYQRVDDVKTDVDHISSGRAVAPETLAAAAPVASAGPAPTPRMSRFALAAVLCPPAALLLGGLVAVFSASGGGLLASVISLVGVGLGIAALGEIRHADGALHGKGLAWVGILAPLLLCVCSPGALFFTRNDGPAVGGGRWHMDDPPKVIGAPPSMTAEQQRAAAVEVGRLWARFEDDLGPTGVEGGTDGRIAYFAPDVVRELCTLDREELDRRAASGELGAPFHDSEPLWMYDAETVFFHDPPETASLVVGHTVHRLRVPLVRYDGKWYFAPGELVRVGDGR